MCRSIESVHYNTIYNIMLVGSTDSTEIYLFRLYYLSILFSLFRLYHKDLIPSIIY